MWRSFLKQHPQIVANNLRFFPQSPIPNAFHHNAVTCQECVALGIMPLLRRVTVLKPVGF
jgi:hypothetical protein